MEKLKKIGVALLANKERAVLALMVLIFGWRVYAVLNSEQSLPTSSYRLPKLDDGQMPKAAVPLAPAPRQPSAWEAVYTPNPFWFLSSQKEVRGSNQGPEDAWPTLLRAQKARGGRARAQIKTPAGTTQWFPEGASFEGFQLVQINADEGTCLVRSERLGDRTLTSTGR